MARFFAFFALFHLSLTFLRPEFPFSIIQGCYDLKLFLDLRKPFDTIDHNFLIKKQHFYGAILV